MKQTGNHKENLQQPSAVTPDQCRLTVLEHVQQDSVFSGSVSWHRPPTFRKPQ